MSFTLQLARLSAEQVAFGYSAAHEALLALHVFFDCKHHPLHIPWVLQARKQLSPALKEEIDAFSLFYKRPLITFWALEADSAFRSFEFDLQDLLHRPVTRYAEEVLQHILRREVSWTDVERDEALQQETLARTKDNHPHSLGVVTELLRDPERSRQRFADLLAAFWEGCLRADWPEIEEQLLRDITLRGGHLLRRGPLGVLEHLSPEITVHPERQEATIRRVSKAVIEFAEQNMLFLSPSYFAWPHLFVKSNQPVILNYSVMDNQQEARPPMPPEHLLKFFKAMGDLTRMQIVQFLAQQPRSTRELAGLIGITEAAVSKHLKQLQEAGLVTAKRESYYVFYRLVAQPFEEMPFGLAEWMRQT
jgi:DNA-binding transcriptional ArsR family regulator